MSEANFVYYDEEMRPQEALRPDMAELIDSPVEVIAEQFVIGLSVAESIYRWHVQIIARVEKIAAARALGQVVSYLLRPHKNRRVRDVGIAFSAGFARELNGIRDMADAASKFGCTRALISHEKRKFDRHMLPPNTTLYGKSPAACKKYKEARIRVLNRVNKNGAGERNGRNGNHE